MGKKSIAMEVKLGGIFGGIAGIAIIAEMILGGFSAEVIAGGVKDIAGTMVAVLVLIAAWLALHPIKDKSFKFEERLDERLNQWQRDHDNMIFVKDDKRDLYMKTDISNFFAGGQSKAAGRFVKVETKEKVVLTFSLNRSLLVGHGEDETKGNQIVDDIGKQIFSYAKGIFSNDADIQYEKSKANLVFTMKSVPESDYEMEKMMEMLNTMYQAFLVCASTKK